MHIGYARVSTEDQTAAAQIEKLQQAGCEKIYRENASGGRWDRPELQECLKYIRKGDVLVVWKLDRLTRSLRDLLHIVDTLEKVGAGFQSLTESIDTTTPVGRMLVHVLGSFAQFEREIIRERTKLGLARARSQGRIGGGRYKLTPTQQTEVLRMLKAGDKTQAEIAELFGVDRSTISRMGSEARQKKGLAVT
jgi:DNA invertase Pin-like site-specific DNA recombinase